MEGMTGYANVEYKDDFIKISVNAKSLNSRFLELKVQVSQNVLFLEKDIREMLAKFFRRGKIEIWVSVSLVKNNSNYVVSVDYDAAKEYFLAVKKLSNELGLLPDIEIVDIIDRVGVIKVSEVDLRENNRVKSSVLSAVKKALKELKNQRKYEGRKIKENVLDLISDISRGITEIESKVPFLNEAIQDKILQKYNKVLHREFDPVEIIGFYSFLFKMDINEELIRLKMHLENLKSLVENGEEIGKKSEFILQEMMRESNTIASKSYSYEINSIIVDIKSCVEKIREHIQNVE